MKSKDELPILLISYENVYGEYAQRRGGPGLIGKSQWPRQRKRSRK